MADSKHPKPTIIVSRDDPGSELGPTIDPESIPAIVADAGAGARFAWEEFIYGTISNPHTREAYLRNIRSFFKWLDESEPGIELRQITPKMVRQYLDEHSGAVATKKQHLSALRHFFDVCVTRHAMLLNPALSVRGERHSVIEGKTPEITIKECRKLLKSIDTETLIGKRDRAIIYILIYTAARIGAVANLKVGDVYHSSDQWMFHFDEKGGKSREIPMRHDMQKVLMEYITEADINLDTEDKKAPLFRSMLRKEGVFSGNAVTRNDISRMLKRRFKAAKLSDRYSGHSFRVTTITDLLEQDVPLEDVQRLAGHADPRTTRLYDRRKKKVTRNIVERISV